MPACLPSRATLTFPRTTTSAWPGRQPLLSNWPWITSASAIPASIQSDNPSLVQAQLGADNGPGFGWEDIDVWKLGVEYKYSQQLTLRAGYNHGDNPISPSDVTFNILAPGVIEDHLTVGFHVHPGIG